MIQCYEYKVYTSDNMYIYVTRIFEQVSPTRIYLSLTGFDRYIHRKGNFFSNSVTLSGIYPDKIFHRYEITYRSVGFVAEAPRGTYLLIDGRRLDPGNQFVPVKEGSELTLECAAEGGNPPPDLAWGMTLSQATLDGPEQPPDNLTVLPSTSGRRSGAHLKVLRGHHNATIACVARHVTLTIPMNASILLDVQCEFTFLYITRFFFNSSSRRAFKDKNFPYFSIKNRNLC